MKRLVERDLYFVQDDLWRISYLDAYNAVIECGLYEYIRDNEIYSYMFSIPSEKSVEFAKLVAGKLRGMLWILQIWTVRKNKIWKCIKASWALCVIAPLWLL